MDAEQRCRVVADCRFVVGQVRAVRRPHFDQTGAALRHDLRYPESAADLDQLAAGDDDLSPGRQRRKRQQQGGRVVVDRHRRLGAGQAAEQRLDVNVPVASFALGEVELEVAIAAARGRHRRYRFRRHGGAPQVGVDDDARGVDHASQAGRGQRSKAVDERSDDLFVGRRRLARGDQRARLLKLLAGHLDDDLRGVVLAETAQALVAQQPVNAGQLPVRTGHDPSLRSQVSVILAQAGPVTRAA